MNKIKVVNNQIIPFVSDDVEINDNSINFNNNGNYFIDYIDCNNVSLCINVNNNKCIHLFEYSSYVDNGIKDCYLNQSTKIVTLGDSDNRVNPNMFISEEDVTAIHSSTIGSINEEDLFYLMSRGISYNDSVKLIIKGMILSNINPDMENMERILSILDSIGGE